MSLFLRVLLRVRMLYYLRQEVVGNQAERILEGADSRWVHFHRLSLSPVIFKDFFLPRQHVLKRGLGELMVKKNLMNYYFSLFLSVLVTSLADSFLLWQMDQAVPLLAKYWSFFFFLFFFHVLNHFTTDGVDLKPVLIILSWDVWGVDVKVRYGSHLDCFPWSPS